MILIAILLIYGIPKYFEARDKEAARDKEIQKFAAELAKEGPVMMIAELKNQITKLEERCTRVESKHDACEAEAAEAKTMIRDRDASIVKLTEEGEKRDVIIAELKTENTELRQEVAELREQIRANVGQWKKTQVAVQGMQDQQDQQTK